MTARGVLALAGGRCSIAAQAACGCSAMPLLLAWRAELA